jgi:TrmH family RNA methyltransferase
MVTPNAVIAVVRIPTVSFVLSEVLPGLSLMLDGIQDPGNLGTIIRIADWFGIRHIICSHACADLYNPKVIQASMGSLMRVKVAYTALTEFLASLPDGFPVYGAVLDGENIMNEKLQSPGILVIGNESKGISPQILSSISRKIKIPAFGDEEPGGKAESLNASVAAALICYEFRRGDSQA